MVNSLGGETFIRHEDGFHRCCRHLFSCHQARHFPPYLKSVGHDSTVLICSEQMPPQHNGMLQEAWRLGIVNEVMPSDQLLSTARALAERIAQVPEPSVRLNKAITCYGLEEPPACAAACCSTARCRPWPILPTRRYGMICSRRCARAACARS